VQQQTEPNSNNHTTMTTPRNSETVAKLSKYIPKKYLDCLCPLVDPKMKQYDSSDDDYTDDDDTTDYYSDDYSTDGDYDDDDDISITPEQEARGAQIARMVLALSQQTLPSDPSKQGVVVMNMSNRSFGKDEDANAEIQTFTSTSTSQAKVQETPMKPREMLNKLLKEDGHISGEPIPYTDLKDYFVRHSNDQVKQYDVAPINEAVRKNDIETLRRLVKEGVDLQCCNQFGESIIHIAARRGYTDLLKFLVKEARCSLQVCCDSGRNPLHDAAWTVVPHFDCVAEILKVCPQFLLISDNRNFTPLDYVPRDCWAEWCTFLKENRDLLPKMDLIV